jgi:hypothetical protein
VEPLAVAVPIQIAYVIGLIAVLVGPVTICEIKDGTRAFTSRPSRPAALLTAGL